MRSYVVLWIPILTERTLNFIAEPNEVELRDVPTLPACRLRGETDEVTKNIKLYYRLGEDSRELELVFTHIESNRLGFVIYEIDDRGYSNGITQDLGTSLHHSIYHYIKGLFHQHSYHEDECDSLLKGFGSPVLLRWNDKGVARRVFAHYADEYSEKLEGYYSTLSAELGFLKLLVNEKKKFRTGLEKSIDLKKESFRIMGEVAYATSLLRMGRSYMNRNQYGRLFDAISKIEQLSEQCSDAYNTINNTYNNSLGNKGIWVGAAGIILTLVLEGVHSCTRSQPDSLELEELNRQNEEIRYRIRRADSLNAENSRVLEAIRTSANRSNR